MRKNIVTISLLVFIIAFAVLMTFFVVRKYGCDTDNEIETTRPQAMMLLIEFKNTDGLVNMVNDMKERNINGILLINGDFAEKNKDVIKEVLKSGNIEIAASYDPKPFWDIPYDEQYSIINDMITKIKSSLGVDVRIISSRYMASDENTLKIADELGIEYITARGTTELATTIYKPEEYNVKIISVSNIDVPEFKYGSFCDYSFYERSGSPEDMTREYERAIQEDKFIGVSHTYIGGQKARWNEMWHNFWDNYDVDWVDLDTLGQVDKVMPTWQIPVNTNAPYTPEKIRPAIPYDEEEDVVNPCRVDDLNAQSNSSGSVQKEETDLVIFHNNTGSMCKDALYFLNTNNISYKQVLNTDDDYYSQLNSYQAKFTNSIGVSDSFEYYPIIFVKNKAYSGFNPTIEKEIRDLLEL